MAYNKAKAERQWKTRKEAEEKLMRKLGVKEDLINRLRDYDWKEFKADRLFYHRLAKMDTYIDHLLYEEREKDVFTVKELLDSIENEQLYRVLSGMDKRTLEIVLHKINGYSSKEISEKCDVSIEAINYRMWYFRKKIKKIL